MGKFNSIEEMKTFYNQMQADLEMLEERIKIVEHTTTAMLSDIGYWNSDKGEYVEYTIDEIRKGEREDGGNVWISEERYNLLKKAWTDAIALLMTF